MYKTVTDMAKNGRLFIRPNTDILHIENIARIAKRF